MSETNHNDNDLLDVIDDDPKGRDKRKVFQLDSRKRLRAQGGVVYPNKVSLQFEIDEPHHFIQSQSVLSKNEANDSTYPGELTQM